MGKLPVRDGQKIDDTDKVMFTSMQDAITLVNSNFDKISLKPKSTFQLKKMIQVSEFVVPNHSKSRSVDLSYRSAMSGTEFQSMDDSIKLHMTKDLKRDPMSPLNSFKLMNQFLEVVPAIFKMEGEFLVVIPGKPGFYTLHFSKGKGNSEVLAEIEFLNKYELKAELGFIKRSVSLADSVQPNQIRYIKKQYPKVTNDQIFEFLSRN